MEEFDEAVEEIQKRRRKRAIKVIIVEGAMVLAVILTVIITTLFTIGYNVKPGGDWTFERTGLVEIETTPSGANLAIDDDPIFIWRNHSHSMTEGEHKITLSKENYDTWQKTISVTAGVYHRLDYPRLFLLDKKIEEKLSIPEDNLISFSKDGSLALEYTQNIDKSSVWKTLEINNDDIKEKSLDPKPLFLDEQNESEVKLFAWSDNSERVVFSRGEEWLILDLKKPENSINLTEKFDIKIDSLKIANNSASEIYIISNGDLRLLNINEEKISGVLVKNIKSFSNFKNEVAYIADNDEDDKNELGLYRHGEKTGKTLSLTIEDPEKNTLKTNSFNYIGLNEYYGEFYLSLIDNTGNFVILRSKNLDNFQKNSDIDQVFYEKLDTTPKTPIEIRGDGELIVVNLGDTIDIFDIEAENVVKITTFLSANWLNEYMVYDITEESTLTVADFDRLNARKMTDTAFKGTEVRISENNKWLYFVSNNHKLSRITISE